MSFKQIAFLVYPFLIGCLLPTLFLLSKLPNQEARAGIIRHAELSADRPLVVRLAMGRSTAISFGVRPEKVVPGNPQALEINFLGRDLTLRPLGTRPGNLIVYTRSSRYVILLQIASDTTYDDAVAVNSFSSYNRPIRLETDTFVVEDLQLTNTSTKQTTSASVLVRNDGKILESELFHSGLQCKGCLLRKLKEAIQLVCSHPTQTLDCTIAGAPYQLKLLGSRS